MITLGQRLERLGLSQYLETFVSEGFDTWETVLDITESDLSLLNVKLGHRRKLQRAIAESRGQSTDRPLPPTLGKTASVDNSYRSDESATETRPKPSTNAAAGSTTTTKRKYRRHPKADENAPERPPSAYVIFSNYIRETLKGQDLSFTETAKVVGEKWQVLPAEARETCERQANTAKEKYYAELSEYRKTPSYDAYQKYLEDFKSKHAAPPKGADGKRTKLETETSTSTQGSINDQGERGAPRKTSLAHLDGFMSHHGSESSTLDTGRIPPGPAIPSTSASPLAHTMSGFNSPRTADPYSPLSASPRSSVMHKDGSFDVYMSGVPRDARGQTDGQMPFPTTTYPPLSLPQSSNAPASTLYGSHYQTPIELPSRRSGRDMQRLPPLSRDDTTLSSDSSNTNAGFISNYAASTLPPIDAATKSMRALPAPVPSLSATPSPLDRPPSQQQQHGPPQPQRPPDYRPPSSLAALLRAGELARVEHEGEMNLEGSP